jgi:hypothetical protein
MLLRPKKESRGPLGAFFRWFNRVFGRATDGYVAPASMLSGVNTTYSSFFFISFKPWDERKTPEKATMGSSATSQGRAPKDTRDCLRLSATGHSRRRHIRRRHFHS